MVCVHVVMWKEERRGAFIEKEGGRFSFVLRQLKPIQNSDHLPSGFHFSFSPPLFSVPNFLACPFVCALFCLSLIHYLS